MPSIDIGIPEAQRQEIAQGLSRLLADTYVLYGNTHGFHWNVTGPMFNTLHLMFMDQYTELWTALDVIAERIRALGVVAPHGGTALGQLASIAEAPQQPPALEMSGCWSAAMSPWPGLRAASSRWPMPPVMNRPQTC